MDTDVLIVGAGPTGLTLAAQLRSFGVRFRLIDRNADRAHESRALAVQARTVEIFLVDPSGEALSRLGVGGGDTAAQYLVRPDRYIAARCGGKDLGFVASYLARWLPIRIS